MQFSSNIHGDYSIVILENKYHENRSHAYTQALIIINKSQGYAVIFIPG